MRYPDQYSAIQGIARFIESWEGVKESDIVPDGSDEKVPFDVDLCTEWLLDRPDLWDSIITGVLSAYETHREEAEAAGKP